MSAQGLKSCEYVVNVVGRSSSSEAVIAILLKKLIVLNNICVRFKLLAIYKI
jgi:hypothetical protein